LKQTSLDLMSGYLHEVSLSHSMLYATLGNKNSDAGHVKCSRRPQVLCPCTIVTFKKHC